jgi:hypothetical protein
MVNAKRFLLARLLVINAVVMSAHSAELSQAQTQVFRRFAPAVSSASPLRFSVIDVLYEPCNVLSGFCYVLAVRADTKAPTHAERVRIQVFRNGRLSASRELSAANPTTYPDLRNLIWFAEGAPAPVSQFADVLTGTVDAVSAKQGEDPDWLRLAVTSDQGPSRSRAFVNVTVTNNTSVTVSPFSIHVSTDLPNFIAVDWKAVLTYTLQPGQIFTTTFNCRPPGEACGFGPVIAALGMKQSNAGVDSSAFDATAPVKCAQTQCAQP